MHLLLCAANQIAMFKPAGGLIIEDRMRIDCLRKTQSMEFVHYMSSERLLLIERFDSLIILFDLSNLKKLMLSRVPLTGLGRFSSFSLFSSSMRVEIFTVVNGEPSPRRSTRISSWISNSAFTPDLNLSWNLEGLFIFSIINRLLESFPCRISIF